MKTEQEIENEIQAALNTIKNYRNEFKNGNITLDVLHDKLIDCFATIGALTWVLGENDRFD